MSAPARRATAQALALAIDSTARCRGTGVWWTRHEVAHAAASTAAAALEASTPALELCLDCPMRQLCADRAAADRYTGLAAGVVYSKGAAHPWDKVIHDALLDKAG